MTYEQFLKDKRLIDKPTGFTPGPLHEALFPFQRDCVKWGLKRGRACFWEDCGLGKTIQQLEWSNKAVKHTKLPGLITAPLNVLEPTAAEAKKFGFNFEIASSAEDVKRNTTYVTNYEKLHKFDLSVFGSAAIDESSILKAFDGKTRNQIIQGFSRTPFKSAWSATPAPNDFMELGNQAEFVGAMSRTEMLSMFFVHDGGDTSQWRLKGHAQEAFWKWLCSWAVNIRKPSDLGYSDDGFILPPLEFKEHIVESSAQSAGFLFPMPASSMAERRDARRGSISERCALTAEIAGQHSKAIIWCNLNSEQDAVAKILGNSCVSIQGSTPHEDRVGMEKSWRLGNIPFLVSKDSIFGWGSNWQHCDTVIYCGLSDSWESFYQTVRRCWRFGQKKPVTAHIVISNLEGAVLANIKRKQADADRMAAEMVKHMSVISSAEIRGIKKTETSYKPNMKMIIPEWLESEAA